MGWEMIPFYSGTANTEAIGVYQRTREVNVLCPFVRLEMIQVVEPGVYFEYVGMDTRVNLRRSPTA